MLLADLQKYEPSLKPIWPEEFVGSLGMPGSPTAPQDNQFFFVKNKKFLEALQKNLAKKSSVGIILQQDFAQKVDKDILASLRESFSYILQVDSVPLAISRLSYPYYKCFVENVNDEVDGRQMGTTEIDSTAYIAQGVFIGARVKIGANVRLYSGVRILSDVEIGDNCEIYPNVTIYHRVKIGQSVRIHAGSVIGSDGFGYNYENGVHHKVWHIGSVVIEDEVEMGANSCIDAGTFAPTLIGAGTKIDNHVQIGHNCHIGKGVVICSKGAIGGSSTIGDFTLLAGRVGVIDNITIGNACQISAGSIVISDFEDNSKIAGYPAVSVQEWMRSTVNIKKLSNRKRS